MDIHNRQNLEEVVLGKVLVRVVRVKLVAMVSQLNESRQGLRNSDHTVQKLLTRTLKTLSRTTKIIALHLALKPTMTMTQATRPKRLTTTRQKLQAPEKTKPMKRKMSRTRPAN